MKAFYAYYGQGMTPAQALRKVQLESIAWMRKYIRHASPSIWAPFGIQISGLQMRETSATSKIGGELEAHAH